jgi:non-specific serine/threonine protein kinase
VAPAVAQALGLREEPGRPLLATLTGFLAPKRLLLVLDNCEHLVAACAELTDTLLRSCPHLRILATSREGLNAAGETRWRVPSLSLPEPWRGLAVGQLPDYSAVRLFVERARARQPGFGLTEGNAAAIVEVCRRLDGIPLAIELAAARLGALSVEQIAARLDDRFRLLTGGPRTVLPRQQTLRAAIDWSYDLLSEAERVLLRRLAVFQGGWTLEAAEAICAGDGLARGAILDGLTGLVEKSQVYLEEAEGEMRYRLLETVQQYASEQLDAAGDAVDVRDRHLDWYLALAAREPRGAELVAWYALLEREHDNLRAALRWSMRESGRAAAGVRLAAYLSGFWQARSHLSEGRRWLDGVLAAGGAPASADRGWALIRAGHLAHIQGDGARAMALFEECLSLPPDQTDQRNIAGALGGLGLVLFDRGDHAGSTVRLEASLALYRQLGDHLGIARALGMLGLIALLQSSLGPARALLEESLALHRGLGKEPAVANALVNLAWVAYFEGDYGRARLLVEESLALFRDLGGRAGCAECLLLMAGLALAQGHAERAARLGAAAEALRTAVGASLLSSPAVSAQMRRGLNACRSALGEEAFAVAWAAGLALTLEQAIAYALDDGIDGEQAG